MAGQVFSGDQRLVKPGTKIPVDSPLTVKGELMPYVSRGGLKLEKALKEFAIDPTGMVALDIGASTGGFTDCLLQHGAKKVYAIDVGYGQLAWKLRQDDRVVVWERTNIRHVQPHQLPELAEIAVIDLAFISLTKVFGVTVNLLVPNGEVVALIKPQFEAGPDQVGKKGIVRDPQVHGAVLHQVVNSAAEVGLGLLNLSYSPVTGAEGNIEFLGHFAKGAERKWPREDLTFDTGISNLVQEAWRQVER